MSLLTFGRSIKRIIFETTFKYDGTGFRQLSVPDIKQIAGRAGRYKTMDQATEIDDGKGKARKPGPTSVGMVTTLDQEDLPIVQRAMRTEPEPIRAACILPPEYLITRFASYFPPETPFDYILLRLHEIARVHWRFQLCQLRDQIAIANAIQEVAELGTSERLTFCACPGTPQEPGAKSILIAYARCVAKRSGGDLLEIPQVDLEVLNYQGPETPEYLRRLEATHRSIVLYLWLSYRFPSVFPSQALGFHVKSLLQAKIDEMLAKSGDPKTERRRLRAKRAAAIKAKQLEELQATETDELDEDDDVAHKLENEAGEEPVTELPMESRTKAGEEGRDNDFGRLRGKRGHHPPAYPEPPTRKAEEAHP